MIVYSMDCSATVQGRLQYEPRRKKCAAEFNSSGTRFTCWQHGGMVTRVSAAFRGRLRRFKAYFFFCVVRSVPPAAHPPRDPHVQKIQSNR